MVQAQFWAELGKPEFAIDILETIYQADTTPQSCLLLLDLYALTNRMEAYQQMNQYFARTFAVKLAA